MTTKAKGSSLKAEVGNFTRISPKTRRMKLELSCRRKGTSTHGFKIEWSEPEEKALETFEHFDECLRAMLKAHGLMKGA